jgi:hypothetical protein
VGDRAEIDRLFADVKQILAERARLPGLLAALVAHGVRYSDIQRATSIPPATAHRWATRARNTGAASSH